MTIKLEVGKRYELNNGEVHVCTKMYGDDPLAVDEHGHGPFVICGSLYHQDGTFAGRAATQKYRGVKRAVDDVQPDATDDAHKIWRDMTPEEKGALLLAHHEGKVIEQFDGEAAFWGVSAPPEWIDSVAYRVKPEPMRERVIIRNFHEKARGFIITFDVIDSVPDCDSIKMEELP